MAATRTQVYLTVEQRDRLDELGRHSGKSLARVIRDAVDCYLEGAGSDIDEALKETFGVAPDIEVPSRSEWDRGYG